MGAIRNKQAGFSAIEALLIIIVIGLLVFVGWYVWHARKTSPQLLQQTKQTVITPKSTAGVYTKGSVKLVPLTNANQTANSEIVIDPAKLEKTNTYKTVASNVKVVSTAPQSLMEWATNTEAPVIAKENADGLAVDPAHPAEQQASFEIYYVTKSGKFAIGSKSNYGDGGANVTLALSNGVWTIVPTGGQSIADCKYIKQYEIPKEILPGCLDYDLHATGTSEQLKDNNFAMFVNMTE